MSASVSDVHLGLPDLARGLVGRLDEQTAGDFQLVAPARQLRFEFLPYLALRCDGAIFPRLAHLLLHHPALLLGVAGHGGEIAALVDRAFGETGQPSMRNRLERLQHLHGLGRPVVRQDQLRLLHGPAGRGDVLQQDAARAVTVSGRWRSSLGWQHCP